MYENVLLTTKYHYEKTRLTFGDIDLIQIGRSHCSKDYNQEERLHLHQNWFELTHVSEGKGTIVTNGVSVQVKAGDLHLSYPGDIHAVYTDPEDLLKFNFLALWPHDPNVLEMLEQVMIRASEPTKRVFHNRNLEYLITSGISEVITNDEHSAEILAASLHQIVRYILRSFGENTKQLRLTVDSAQELCYQMMNYISTHIYVMNNLSALADFFGYSYSYLSDLFHKTTGDTLVNCYTTRRMEAAAMLLNENKMSVSAIAELLKYASIYSFSRAFKTYWKVSPTAYKQLYAGNVMKKKSDVLEVLKPPF